MPNKAPARYTPGRSYARGVEARQRITEVAIQVFGNLGYDDASTRTIAARAKVNLGLLRYYFGSKKSLYLASAEHIATYCETKLEPYTQRIAGKIAASDQSRAQLLDIVHAEVDELLDHLLAPRGAFPWVLFLLREQLDPGPAYALLYDRLTRRMIELWAGLIAQVLGQSARSEETLLKTIGVVGQIFTYQRNLYIVKRALNWDTITPRRLAKMKSVLWQQIQAGLTDRAGRQLTHSVYSGSDA